MASALDNPTQGLRAAGMDLSGAPPALEQGRVEPESSQMEPEQGRMQGTRATASREEDIRLPVREEEFVAEKQAAETKHLHLHKHVVGEQATSSLSVTREEVTIERVPAQEGSLASDENAFSEQRH